MIEIVFDESALGSLRQACHEGRGNVSGMSCQVLYVSPDGKGEMPSPAQIKGDREEAERRARQAAVPMDSSPQDLFGLALFLSVGDLRGDGFWETRRETLARLFCVPEGEEVARESLARSREDYDRLMARAAAGEDLRVWYSDSPHEACGLRWLCWELDRLPHTGRLWAVKLPPWITRPDGTVWTLRGWGEMEPGQWSAQLPRQQEVPSALRKGLARQWADLREENAPLRAVIDGVLHSVPADFYDGFLRREIVTQPEEFFQAQVIGQTLANLPGVSDGWLFLRMEEMIAAGLLEADTPPEAQVPYYHRTLRKVLGKW